jgi:hypothetical protein
MIATGKREARLDQIFSANGAPYDSQGQATKERRPWKQIIGILSPEKGEIDL